MQNVILVIHILACLAMIGLGLGIGGGGANSLMSGRGAAGAIVRTTIIIGGIFFATSLALTSIANRNSDNRSGIEKALEETAPAGVSGDPVDLFDPSVSLVESDPAPATTSDAPVVTDPPADATAVEVPLPAAPETAPETAPTETNPQ